MVCGLIRRAGGKSYPVVTDCDTSPFTHPYPKKSMSLCEQNIYKTKQLSHGDAIRQISSGTVSEQKQ